MTEVLSQSDLSYLLDAIETIDSKDGSAGLGERDSLADKQIKLYNFRHPDRFSKEQIRTVEVMHETFARFMTNSLSTQLRTLVDVHVQSVSQITYEEFVKTIPNPTLFAVLDMFPLKGNAILEINPSLTFTIIERLFGGVGDVMLNRELTEIEQSVCESIVEGMLGYFREAWRKIVNLRTHLVQIETNTQLVQIIPPTEMMIMIMLNCRINDVEGMINIGIPYITIEPIIGKLSAHTWYTSGIADTDIRAQENLRLNLRDAIVDIKAVLGKLSMTVKEVVSLQKGDVLQLNEVRFEDPISVYVEQQEKFKAIPGRLGNRKAVRIVESLDLDLEQILLDKKNSEESVVDYTL